MFYIKICVFAGIGENMFMFVIHGCAENEKTILLKDSVKVKMIQAPPLH